MKTSLPCLPLALCGLAAWLSIAPAASAAPRHVADPAVELLAYHGTLPLLAAGPYVERGTVRVQVAAKLGRPDAVLPDGTWLYHAHQVVDSAASGTLVVQFRDDRVTTLSLATPAKIASLRHAAIDTARRAKEHLAGPSAASPSRDASHD